MDWTRGRIIGRGSTAAISVATDLFSGELLAVKSVEFSRSEFLERERAILSSLDCPQIIRYKGYDITFENGELMSNLFMEFAAGGSIVDAMEAAGGCLNEAVVRSYTREILYGLEYLHSNGLVHCDIKCHNILVAEEGIKIADFGCARRVGEVSGGNLAGTPIFMAPEVARGEQQGFAADVWAVGCSVIQMVTGRAPWVDVADPMAALYRIASGDDVPVTPTFMSEQGKDFLRRCLIRDPEERWSVSELLKHPFLDEQKSLPKKNLSCDSYTPTSILEQVYWDSVNDSEETTHGLTQQKNSRTPLQRLQQLSELSKTQYLGIPSWELNEDWVTVRSNDTERNDCSLTLKFPCFSEFISSNESDRNGVDNQYCFSINFSSSSNCSRQSSEAKKRDLAMTSVCLKTVTLKTINSSDNKRLCIIVSFMELKLLLFFSDNLWSNSVCYLDFRAQIGI